MTSENKDIAEQMNYKTMAEIRTMNNPPELVKQIMMACCVLLGDFDNSIATNIKPAVPFEYWRVVKHSMGSSGFNKRLSDLNPTTIPMEFVTSAKQYIQETSVERVKKVSMGATYCYNWAMGVIAKAETNQGELKCE